MFAHLKGTPMEYSVSDKLREIDVANENLNSSADYTGKVSFFKCSEAYAKINTFMQRINHVVQGQTISQLRGEAPTAAAGQAEPLKRVQIFASDVASAATQNDAAQPSAVQPAAQPAAAAEPTPASILAIAALLKEVEALIAECPPTDKSAVVAATSRAAAVTDPLARSAGSDASVAAPPASAAASLPPGSRFGSPAFRQFLTLLTERAPAMLGRVLDTVPADIAERKWSIVDAVQSEESRALEAAGHETLRNFRRLHDGQGKGAATARSGGHRLPAGVVIQHGPHGVGNGPGLVGGKAAAEVKQLIAHAHGDECAHGSDEKEASAHSEHKHEHGHEGHKHEHAAPAAKDTSLAGQRERLIGHLSRYLVQCWGDIRRLDYGTGHELHFLCLLSALGDAGLFDLSSDLHVRRLVGLVFVPYVRLMRLLQSTYWLEPAGSRGVWGLDDYCFLPFLFGSAQLLNHRNLKPKSVRYPEILDGFADEYLYLDCVRFVLQVKTCSFAEHSPMLNDITVIKGWGQVNAGLQKMYQAEVMGKFAVVQHFIYSPMLSQWPVKALEVEEVKEEAPCCGDAIHFPSAIAAKQTTQAAPPRL